MLVFGVACLMAAAGILGYLIGHGRGYRLGQVRGRIDEQTERHIAEELDRQVVGDGRLAPGAFEGIKFVTDPNVPPREMYLLDERQLGHDGKSGLITEDTLRAVKANLDREPGFEMPKRRVRDNPQA